MTTAIMGVGLLGTTVARNLVRGGERVILTAAGFDPVKVGGVDQSIRVEFGGDLSEFGLNGRLPTIAEAEALIGVEVH
jgi:predicted dinucleotide-binding enzyme